MAAAETSLKRTRPLDLDAASRRAALSDQGKKSRGQSYRSCEREAVEASRVSRFTGALCGDRQTDARTSVRKNCPGKPDLMVEQKLTHIYDDDCAASNIPSTSENFARGAPSFAFARSAISIRRQSDHDVPSP